MIGIGTPSSWLFLLITSTLVLWIRSAGLPERGDGERIQADAPNPSVKRVRRDTTDGSGWEECHGFPQSTCIALRDKMTELQQILDQRSAADGKTYSHYILGNSTDALKEEEIYLTPGQVQYFIDTLGNRRRHKRKVDSFSQFVTKWPLPIHYQFDGSHGVRDRERIKEAISHWESQTCLRFQEIYPGDYAPNDRIVFMKYKGCGSYIGKVNINPQPVDLTSRCLRHMGIIAHELGHVIGFWHEHQRSDRDSYINIKTRNAVLGVSFLSELMRLGRTSNLLSYDYGSVLHYNAKTMSSNGDYTIETKDSLYQQTIGQRTGLSFLDAKLANMVYCEGQCRIPLRERCANEGYQDPNACHQCRCPDGFTGTYCRDIAPPIGANCGASEITVSQYPQFILSPNYHSRYYHDHTQCTWLLKAPVGQQINLRFEGDFGIYCVEDTCFHWVEVRYDVLSTIGPRFCCQELPQVTLRSTGNEMLVLFRSNYSTVFTNFRRGFKARFWTVPGQNQRTVAFPNQWFTNGPRRTTGVPPKPHRGTAPAAIIQAVTQVPPTTPGWPNPSNGQSCSPLDVAFILDSSGSVGFSNWKKLIQFTVDLVRLWNIGYNQVRVAAVAFGSTASLHFDLLDYTDQSRVLSALQSIRWKDEMTNTSGGIWMSRTGVFNVVNGDRPWAPDVALLITDGESNRDESRTVPEAVRAKQAGMNMVVVGVGNRLKRAEVEGIASAPLTETLFFVRSFDDLFSIQQQVSSRVCSFAGSPVTRLTTPAFTFLTRRTTLSSSTSRLPPRDCSEPTAADIAFVIDSSGSIGQLNWRKILEFIKTFVGYLSIDNSIHRVGIVTFGTSATLEFGLDAYRTGWQLKDAVDQLRWKDEMTNTSGGIRVMRENMFDYRKGDRPNVPNIAIVLTDGESNRDQFRVKPEASLARAAGTAMFVIGIGQKLNMVELNDIASDPRDQYLYRTQDFNDLNHVITNIIHVICTLTRSTGPTAYPSPQPTQYPTQYPNPYPTPNPTQYPTVYPRPNPTQYPRPNPTRYPTPNPTQYPTPNPTRYPTPNPTQYPRPNPTRYPTPNPTQYPRPNPTRYPTPNPTQYPRPNPTRYPTPNPTQYPRPNPTRYPTPNPTQYPRPNPTRYPTQYPTPNPTQKPTQSPSWTRIPSSTKRSSPGGGVCPKFVDIAFVLDSSGSVSSYNWPLALNFTKNIIKSLPYGQDDYQFAVVSFGNQASLDIRLGEFQYQIDILGAIDSIRWKDEWTNTSGGLKVMRQQLTNYNGQGARPNALKIGILITDGESNRDQPETIPQALLTQQQGIKVFAIGVGPNVDDRELEAIASDPDSWYLMRVDSYQKLWTLARDVVKKICGNQTPGPQATTASTTTSSRRPVYTVTPSPTPTTTQATNVPPRGIYSDCHPLDIGIAIDSSNSVGRNNWRRLLNFVAELVRSLPVSPTEDRIGVITFGNTATLDIPLDRYLYKDGLIDAILRLPWKDEFTNTSGAILVMRSQLLTNRDHSRNGVPKIGLVITDGMSNIDAHLTVPEANVARQQGIEMYAIGVTSQASVQEVQGIADEPSSEHAYMVDSFDRLNQIKNSFLNNLCARYDRSGQRVVPGQRRTESSSSTTTTTPIPQRSGWGQWTDCSRPCGGCGRRWRYRQCADSQGRYSDCGLPEESPCNTAPCTAQDVCTFYVAWKRYNRPCQPCCYGYQHSTRLNQCIPV